MPPFGLGNLLVQCFQPHPNSHYGRNVPPVRVTVRRFYGAVVPAKPATRLGPLVFAASMRLALAYRRHRQFAQVWGVCLEAIGDSLLGLAEQAADLCIGEAFLSKTDHISLLL